MNRIDIHPEIIHDVKNLQFDPETNRHVMTIGHAIWNTPVDERNAIFLVGALELLESCSLYQNSNNNNNNNPQQQQQQKLALKLVHLELDAAAIKILSAYFQQATRLVSVSLVNLNRENVQNLLTALQTSSSVQEIVLDRCRTQGFEGEQAGTVLSRFLQNKRGQNLKRLTCRSIRLGPEGMLFLQPGIQAACWSLRQFDLDTCSIGDGGGGTTAGIDLLMESLVKGVYGKQSVERLSLGHNQLSSAHIPRLVDGLKQLPQLTELSVAGNPRMFQVEEMTRRLCRPLLTSPHATIKVLSLSACQLHGSNASIVLQAVAQSKTLEVLDLVDDSESKNLSVQERKSLRHELIQHIPTMTSLQVLKTSCFQRPHDISLLLPVLDKNLSLIRFDGIPTRAFQNVDQRNQFNIIMERNQRVHQAFSLLRVPPPQQPHSLLQRNSNNVIPRGLWPKAMTRLFRGDEAIGTTPIYLIMQEKLASWADDALPPKQQVKACKVASRTAKNA